MSDFKMVAKCFKGMEMVLANEVKTLGGREVKRGRRMVEFVGDKGFMYKANYSLRSALRILKPIHRYRATDDRKLYEGAVQFPWEDYFDVKQSFAIFSTVQSDYFRNSMYAALKVKDAIVDRFYKVHGKRPNVDRRSPDVSINLHISENSINISLDSSGDSLHKRGYRVENAGAPLNEVMAASLVQLSGWNGKGNFLDPMCGSGTIVIEAALFAAGIPPQIQRKNFGFMHWKDFDKDLFQKIKSGRIDRIKEPQGEIVGYELQPLMAKVAKMNAKSAEVLDIIRIENKDFFKSKKELYPLHLVFNPPYDQRFKIDQEDFYSRIAENLTENYPSTLTWIFTGDLEAKDKIELESHKNYKLLNGKIECDFLGYEIP